MIKEGNPDRGENVLAALPRENEYIGVAGSVGVRENPIRSATRESISSSVPAIVESVLERAVVTTLALMLFSTVHALRASGELPGLDDHNGKLLQQ